jgi:phytoene dehydrogenase-like protein
VSEKQVIIIGAGLAGLATGCYAQMNGYQTRIYEHHVHPGGVAAAWRRGEYLIDGGIHFVMGHRPGTGLHDLYRQLGIVPNVSFKDMTTYGRFIDEASGRTVTVTRDLDRLARDLKALSPPDADIVDELIAGARAFQGADMSEMGMSKPPELASALNQIRDLWTMRRLFKYVVGRYGQPVADYAQAVDAPWLRSCIEGLFLPDVPVYFVFMLLGLLADGQLGFIDGSCADLVHAVEERYRSLGGEVTYKARVEEILVEGDRAVGVRLADSASVPREQRAGAVVSAADGRSTIFKMLGGRYLNEKIEERYQTWPRFRPLLMFNYGVAREYPDDAGFVTVRLEQPLAIGDKQIDALMVRNFHYSAKFAPPGKTVIQAELETEWDYWHDLRRADPADYEAEKERLAQQVLERLEAHYPGISAEVEESDVSTPYTWWRYTLNDEGAWEGWLMTPSAIRTPIERTLPGLDGFYMAGQWVMPGGGVPPVLYSGRHVVQLLCKEDGKSFVTDTRAGTWQVIESSRSRGEPPSQ